MAATTHIVAMPFPCHGHVNPTISLCRLLASRDLLVTFVVTEEWLGLLSGVAPTLPPNLHLRTIPNVIHPDHTIGTDFPGFYRAVSTKLEAPFEQVLDRLEHQPDGVLADAYLPWTAEVAHRRGIPVFSLWMQPASVLMVFHHFDLLRARYRLPISLEEIEDELVDCIPGMKDTRLSDLHSHCFDKELMPLKQKTLSSLKNGHGLILTSSYELEPSIIDSLKAEVPFPIYTLGPSIPYAALQERPPFSKDDNYFSWLDSQPRSSVLYVSTGSFLLMSEAQLNEIAAGLALSGVRYLWVSQQSPSQVQATAGEMGMVIPWCKQLKVLCHPSVGGFSTHCGWNSTMEAVYAGVTMLAFPLSLDQFHVCHLIVDEWKVGMRMKRQMGEETLVGREVIAKLVKMVMDLNGDESKELRKRAKALQIACHRALDDGGSSLANLDAFVKLVRGHRS